MAMDKLIITNYSIHSEIEPNEVNLIRTISKIYSNILIYSYYKYILI